MEEYPPTTSLSGHIRYKQAVRKSEKIQKMILYQWLSKW
jgi:hypothetical protein